MAITVDGELILTSVLFIGAKLTIDASRREVRAGGISKGKLVASAFLFLALARVWVAECERVAVGGEFVRPELKPVVVYRTCATILYVPGVDEGECEEEGKECGGEG